MKAIMLATALALFSGMQTLAAQLSAITGDVQAQERAFPGAEGWAAATPGGRGGEILRVTTLAATGPGSFADAISAKRPRIIVFEVGGVIDLNRQTLEVTEPYVTIAGQTAPSPGITLIRGGISVRTHDVVVQHIRVRPGRAGYPVNDSTWYADGLTTYGPDAYNVIVDHCSFSWATDENLSVSGPLAEGETPEDWRRNTSRKVTLSNNLIAEAFGMGKSKGTLLHTDVTDVLIYGNLYANHGQRSPVYQRGAWATMVNNFIYNPGGRAVDYHAQEGRDVEARMVLVGNVMRHGPDTRPGLALMLFLSSLELQFHASDNLAFDTDGNPVDVVWDDPRVGGTLTHRPRSFYWPEGLEARPASEVEDHVLANAGARPWDRDDVDRRVLQQTRDGTGRLVNHEDEVGGYPEMAPTYRQFNPDEWDLRYMTPRSSQVLQ